MQKPVGAAAANKTKELDMVGLCQAIAEFSPLPMAAVQGPTHIIIYVNPSLCQLVGRTKDDLLGTAFPAADTAGEECLSLLDSVYQTGKASTHTGQEGVVPHPLFWSYAIWPVLTLEGHLAGTIIQVIQTTTFHQHVTAMNEALLISSVRQHELTEAAEKLNEQLEAEIQERNQAETALTGVKEDLRALAASLITAQEEERRRIARELHDDLGQHLALLQINLTQLLPNATSWKMSLSAAIVHVAKLSEGVRQLSHRLHPSVLELGVDAALRSLCEEWESTYDIPIHYTCQALSRSVPLAVSTVLYRITNEALRNVQKHAGDARVTLVLSDSGRQFDLTISDDGVGFDCTTARSRGGLGMISMQERAAVLGGCVKIRSAPDEGTVIRVSIPWP